MSDTENLICPHRDCRKPNSAENMVCNTCGRPLDIYAKLFFLPIYLFNEGLKAYRAGSIEEAIGSLTLARRLNPKEPDTLNLLGKIYAKHISLKTAIDLWLDALEIDPKNGAALKCLAAAQKIMDAQKQNKDEMDHIKGNDPGPEDQVFDFE